MPEVKGDADHWVRVDDADRYGRGGLLPMAVFLTQNSPGLRTSPVKRGNWVVQRVLGEVHSAAAAGRARIAARRGEDRSAAARHAGQASRESGLRRAATRASIRSAWRLKARTGRRERGRKISPDGRSIPQRSLSRRQPGRRDSKACRLTSASIARRISSIISAANCWPIALSRSLQLSDEPLIERMKSQAGGERLSLRFAGGDHRHQSAVPEQTERPGYRRRTER